ncbi:MAG: PAS domain S-box protein [Candidatus Acidiferrales bacterium]
MAEEASKVKVAPREVRKYLAQITLVFVAYSVADKLGQVVPLISSGGIGPVWPASGIALAALFIFGYQVWPGIAAGALFLALLSHFSPAAAVIYAIGVTLAALAGRFLLRRVVNFNPSLSRLRDVFGLIALGAFGSSVVSASIGAPVLYIHLGGWSGFGRAWLIYWLGDSMGVLLVAPLVLSLANLRKSHVRPRIPELVALLVLLTVSCLIVFGDLPVVSVRLHIFAFAVLPFIIWAAVRFGLSGATLTTFFTATIATVETAHGSGPFAQNTPFTNDLLLTVFFAVLSVSGMTLAAVIAEREQAEREREQLVRQQAAMQARLRLAAIVESSDDAIIGKDMNGIITEWNNGAERLYGYPAAEVIGKPVSLLVPPECSDDLADTMAMLRRGQIVKNRESQRQTKDGTRIHVSLTMSALRDLEGRIVGVSTIARDVSERKRQEIALRESEGRFRLVADTAPVLIWMSDPDKLCTFFNQCWLDFTGRSMEQELGSGWVAAVHPEDLARVLGIYSSAFDARVDFEMEYRLKRFDGKYRWIVDYGVPRFESDGAFCGYIGSCVDITDRKLAAESLEELSGRLITAQDEERTRIARELHDDFSQRLALQGIGLAQLWKKMPESDVAERAKVQELLKGIQEISSDMHSLSHQLHSSKLEHVGLAPALMGLCEELSSRFKVQIKFTDNGLSSGIPKDVGLCLFRIAQEALGNVVKHSGAKEAHAELCGTRNEIRLRIVDTGFGFDPDLRNGNAGLGLVSMRERLRLVGGRLSVQSAPMQGTEILAEVPLAVPANEAHVRVMTSGGITS